MNLTQGHQNTGKVADEKRAFVLKHLTLAKSDPTALAHSMKHAGLYAKSTAISDILRLIGRVVKEAA
jgi:hypothetical protein